ncbi:MAG: substrate-binding domain-containing protein [Acetobacteraceae bacterium]
MTRAGRFLMPLLLAAAAVALAPAARAASNCVSGTHKPPYKVGWADIYLAPTWMAQTHKLMDEATAALKKEGLVTGLTVTNANGNASQQIQQIQSMIDSRMDLIIVDAGSATALDRVIASACRKGIAVVNFDSLVNTNDLTAKIDTDQVAWGRMGAEWLVKELGGKGDILVLNGPAGVSVSEARWHGAKPVFAADKGIHIAAIVNSEYNVAPAEQAVSNLLYAHPHVGGIWSQGGALSAGAVLALQKAGRKIVPMTGENYLQFLKMWHKDGFAAWATGQPNWMGSMAIYVGVWALQGQDIARYIDVPLPAITNANLADYIARGKSMPADGYVYPPYSVALYKSLVEKAAAK